MVGARTVVTEYDISSMFTNLAEPVVVTLQKNLHFDCTYVIFNNVEVLMQNLLFHIWS